MFSYVCFGILNIVLSIVLLGPRFPKIHIDGPQILIYADGFMRRV